MVENIYKIELTECNAYFFQVEKGLIIASKVDGTAILNFYGNVANDNISVREFVITKEDFEMYQYFLHLYNSFLLYDSLNKQVDIESMTKKSPVEYITKNNDGEKISKFSMKLEKDTIKIIIEKLKDTDKEFIVKANYKCPAIINFYNEVDNNHSDYHQIDIEELLYQKKKQRTRK